VKLNKLFEDILEETEVDNFLKELPSSLRINNNPNPEENSDNEQ